MTEREQITHLSNEIDKLINRYRDEYDLSYAAVVGILQMKSHLLMSEAEASEDSD